MKTTIAAITIVIFSLPALAGLDNPPAGFTLDEEKYIDDIPFNTAEVVLGLETELQDEAYVDDIPFNTRDILLFEGIALAEEENVDDMEFDSEVVLTEAGLELQEESYVDDIPFSTIDVLLLSGIDLQEEEMVNDIPFDTECIVQSVNTKCTNWVPCMIPFDGKTMELGSSHRQVQPESLELRRI